MALAYWISAGVPQLSESRIGQLPIGERYADDPGLYVIVPWLLNVIPDVRLAVWAIALVAFSVTLLWLYPRGPLVVIVLVLAAKPPIAAGAAYWVPAWAIWTGLFASPVGSALVGLLATPFRGAAGPPLIAWSWRSWRVGILAIAAYVGLTVLLGSHLFWHTAYIGLGWYPNDYGITYADEAGMAAAAGYPTPAYEAALRAKIIDIALTDPLFVGRTVLLKLAEAVRFAMPWVLLLPFAFYRRPALVVPVALTLLPAILAVPQAAYLTGWLAAVLAAPLVAFSGSDRRDVLGAELVPTRVLGIERQEEPGVIVTGPGPVG